MFIEEKLKNILLDPSIFYRWWSLPDKKDIENLNLYIPKSLLSVNKQDRVDFDSFYLGSITEDKRIDYNAVRAIIDGYDFDIFERSKALESIPEEFVDVFDSLQKAEFKFPIKDILLDEFVFLTTQSCVVSRVKKSFKQFEKVNIFPLIDFGKIVPDEWKNTVKGLKKIANIIAFIGTFMVTEDMVSSVITGTSLFIVDP
jgi:hypothetical protein